MADVQISFKLEETVAAKLDELAEQASPKRSKHQVARDLVTEALTGRASQLDSLESGIKELRESLGKNVGGNDDASLAAVGRLHDDLLVAVTYILIRLHPEREVSAVQRWVADNLGKGRPKGAV